MARFVDTLDLVGRAVTRQGGSISELNDLCFDVAAAAIELKDERDAVSAALAVLLANRHLPTLQRCQCDLYFVSVKDTDDEAYQHLIKAENSISRLDAICRESGIDDSRVPMMKQQIANYRAYFAQPANVRAQAFRSTAVDADLITRSRALHERNARLRSRFLATPSSQPSNKQLLGSMLGPNASSIAAAAAAAAAATTSTSATRRVPDISAKSSEMISSRGRGTGCGSPSNTMTAAAGMASRVGVQQTSRWNHKAWRGRRWHWFCDRLDKVFGHDYQRGF